MAYEGDEMIACPQTPYNFDQTYAVVVSGDGPNFCGHLILKVGLDANETYLHVAGVRTQPRQMDAAGYRRYLKETGKREIKRFRVPITKPDDAMRRLEILLSKKWLWGVLPHNCASFVEDIVEAGGSSAGLYLNCPTLERFQ
jgi:hypothetical protein